jgi:hypothetical protein
MHPAHRAGAPSPPCHARWCPPRAGPVPHRVAARRSVAVPRQVFRKPVSASATAGRRSQIFHLDLARRARSRLPGWHESTLLSRQPRRDQECGSRVQGLRVNWADTARIAVRHQGQRKTSPGGDPCSYQRKYRPPRRGDRWRSGKAKVQTVACSLFSRDLWMSGQRAVL